MTLSQLYEEQDYRVVSSRVTIGGRILIAPHLRVRWGFARGRVPTCSFTIPNPPDSTITAWHNGRRAAFKLEVGFGGFYATQFVGRVESATRSERGCTIECSGESRQLDATYQRVIPVTFVGDANDIVEELLDDAGIDDYVVDLPEWEIGSVVQQTLEFQSYGEAVNKVSEVDGSVWHEMPNGQVRVGVYDPMPAPAPFRTYYAAVPSGITESQPDGVTNVDARPRIRSIEIREYPREVRNRVHVRGAIVETVGPGDEVNGDTIETTAPGASPWIPSGKYVDYPFLNELIDTPAKAASVAYRHFGLKNRLETRLLVRVSGDPQVFLGATVQIEDPAFAGVSGKWFVESYNAELDGAHFETTLELRGGGPAAGSTPSLHPFAAFTWGEAKFSQSVPASTPGGPVAGGIAAIVTFDGSSSQDFDGSIASHAWSDDQANVGTGPIVSFVYDPAVVSTVAVTLEVTDNDGNTDTLTQNVLVKGSTANPTGDDTLPGGAGASGGQILTTHLFCAADAHAQGTANGGITWNDLTKAAAGVAGNFISVSAAFDPDTSVIIAVFGTAAGELVRTIDHCATGTLVATIGGGPRIEDVWADTVNRGIWWACTANGQIWRSADDGVTWSLYHAFADGFPLYAIGTPGSGDLWVFGGNTSNFASLIRRDISKTGNWQPLAIEGALLAAVTAAGAGHHVVAAASREGGDLAIMFDSGVTPRAWYTPNVYDDGLGWVPSTGLGAGNGVALAPNLPGPGDLVGIIATTTSYVAADGITYSAAGVTPSQINHLFWEAPQFGVYLGAAAGGIVKSLDKAATWGYIRPLGALTWPAGDTGRKISFVAAPQTPADGQIYLLASDGGTRSLLRLTVGNVWEVVNSARPSGFFGLQYFGAGRMIHLVDGGIPEISSDSGVTWAPVTALAGYVACSSVALAPDGRLWGVWQETGATPPGAIGFSDDWGATWTLSLVNPMATNPRLLQVACHPIDPNKIAVSGRSALSRRLLATIDRGDNWTQSSSLGTDNPLSTGGLSWTPSGRIIFAFGSGDSDIKYTDDLGVSSVTVLTIGHGGTSNIRRHLLRCGNFGPYFLIVDFSVAATELYRSLDHGGSWTLVTLSGSTDPTSLAYDILTDRLYIAGGGIGVESLTPSETGAAWVSHLSNLAALGYDAVPDAGLAFVGDQ